MTEHEVIYKKPAPPEWEPLVAQFEVIAASDKPLEEQAEEGFELVSQSLDQKTRERNRHYGLGLVTRRFSEILYDPEVWNGVIDMSGEHLAGTVADGDLLRIKHLRKNAFSHGMAGVVLGAFSEQPVSHSLLIHALYGAVHEHAFRDHPAYSSPEELHKEAMGKLRRHGKGIVTQRSVTNFHGSIVGGTNLTFMQAMKLIAAERNFQNVDNYPLPHNAWLRNLSNDLYMPATRAATTRIDKFNKMPLFIERQGEDKWRTNMEKFIEPEVVDPTRTYHDETLGCPALYVGGAIRQMLGIYSEIIINARQRLVNGEVVT